MTGPQLPGLEEVDPEKYVTPLRSLELAKCRTCNRDIFWVRSPAGANLPIDARPVDPHTFAIVIDPDFGPQAVKLAFVLDDPDRPQDGLEADRVFVSHWLTCPRPPAPRGTREPSPSRPASSARGHGGPAYVQGGNGAARNSKYRPGTSQGPRR